MDQELNMTSLMDMWEEYDHIAFEERCYEYDKAECYQNNNMEEQVTLNQIRIHNDGSEKRKPVRSLLSEVKCSKIISMEDWTTWIWITFKEPPKGWEAIFKMDLERLRIIDILWKFCSQVAIPRHKCLQLEYQL